MHFPHFHHSVIYRPRHLPDSLTQRFICRNKYHLASQIHSPGRTEGWGWEDAVSPSLPAPLPTTSLFLPTPPSSSLTSSFPHPPGRLNITPLPVIKQPVFFPSHPLFSSKTDRNFFFFFGWWNEWVEEVGSWMDGWEGGEGDGKGRKGGPRRENVGGSKPKFL